MKAFAVFVALILAAAPAHGRKPERSHSKSASNAKELRESERAKDKRSWRDYKRLAPKKGYVQLQSTVGRWKGHVIGRKKEILSPARTAFERVFASWRTGKRHEISPKLISLVVKISDTFGGRPIFIASGYREHSFYSDSKHRTGEAVDLRVEGVPNELLRDYLRTQRGVAVGYYPNSSFVHVDVRGYSAYWVDYAGPGEKPRNSERPRRTKKQPRAQSKRGVRAASAG